MSWSAIASRSLPIEHPEHGTADVGERDVDAGQRERLGVGDQPGEPQAHGGGGRDPDDVEGGSAQADPATDVQAEGLGEAAFNHGPARPYPAALGQLRLNG
jgi:hypothetical protein